MFIGHGAELGNFGLRRGRKWDRVGRVCYWLAHLISTVCRRSQGPRTICARASQLCSAGIPDLGPEAGQCVSLVTKLQQMDHQTQRTTSKPVRCGQHTFCDSCNLQGCHNRSLTWCSFLKNFLSACLLRILREGKKVMRKKANPM